MQEYWNIDIKPKSSFFSLRLNELWSYRDLVQLLVKRDFTAKYKQTILGPVWHLIQPALTTIVSFLLFNMVANLGTDGKNAILFQMSGIIIWNYFANCFTGTANTFTANAGVFGKVYFPRLVMPVSVVISNLVQLAIQCLLLTGTILFFVVFRGETVSITADLLFVPIVVVMMAGIGLGLGIMVSSITTKYRDFSVLISFGVQLLMFGSAVNYPISELEKGNHAGSFLYYLVKWNPISTLVESFRNGILGGPINFNMLGYTVIFMLFSILLGILMFNKVERNFMDTV